MTNARSKTKTSMASRRQARSDREFAIVIVEPYEDRDDPTDFLIVPFTNLMRRLPNATPNDLIMLTEMIEYGRRADYSPMVAWTLHGLNERHGFDGLTHGFVRREAGGQRWFVFVEPEPVLELA